MQIERDNKILVKHLDKVKSDYATSNMKAHSRKAKEIKRNLLF